MEIETSAIHGSYDELLDIADDLAEILSAAAEDRLDLTPPLERWLVRQLEEIELALTRRIDGAPVLEGRGPA